MKKELVIIAGPNGAGKTVFARRYLIDKSVEFLNADEIALGLSPKDILRVRITAGRVLLERLNALIESD